MTIAARDPGRRVSVGIRVWYSGVPYSYTVPVKLSLLRKAQTDGGPFQAYQRQRDEGFWEDLQTRGTSQ